MRDRIAAALARRLAATGADRNEAFLASYSAATPVAQLLTVNKAPPTILTPPVASDIVYGQTLASSFLNEIGRAHV